MKTAKSISPSSIKSDIVTQTVKTRKAGSTTTKRRVPAAAPVTLNLGDPEVKAKPVEVKEVKPAIEEHNLPYRSKTLRELRAEFGSNWCVKAFNSSYITILQELSLGLPIIPLEKSMFKYKKDSGFTFTLQGAFSSILFAGLTTDPLSEQDRALVTDNTYLLNNVRVNKDVKTSTYTYFSFKLSFGPHSKQTYVPSCGFSLFGSPTSNCQVASISQLAQILQNYNNKEDFDHVRKILQMASFYHGGGKRLFIYDIQRQYEPHLDKLASVQNVELITKDHYISSNRSNMISGILKIDHLSK